MNIYGTVHDVRNIIRIPEDEEREVEENSIIPLLNQYGPDFVYLYLVFIGFKWLVTIAVAFFAP